MKAVVVFILMTVPLLTRAQFLMLLHERMRKKRMQNRIEQIQKQYKEVTPFDSDTVSINVWLDVARKQMEETKETRQADNFIVERGGASIKLNYVLSHKEGLSHNEKSHYLEEATELGNDSARCYLAHLLYYNYRKDPRRVYDLLLESEREGSRLCNYLLGVLYYQGLDTIGIKRDYAKAVRYFQTVDRDCEYYRSACYYLFKCYRYGRGVESSLSTSLHYLKETARRVNLHAFDLIKRPEERDVTSLYKTLVDKEEQRRIRRKVLKEAFYSEESLKQAVSEPIKDRTPTFGLE